ncbi:hypothetical protein D3C76_1817770 [compost metagenome]
MGYRAAWGGRSGSDIRGDLLGRLFFVDANLSGTLNNPVGASQPAGDGGLIADRDF